MIRKFAAALVVLGLAVGSVFAEEIRGTFVKFSDDKLTLKVDDKEKEYKVPSGLKLKRKGKDGTEREFEASAMLGKMKEGAPLVVTVEKDEVKDIRFGGKGKGKNE